VILKTFGWSFGVTVAGLITALLYGGPEALFITAILGVLEVSLSFDNAVINATVLERMNPFWQKLFLSVGIIIAVFGMRLLFPLLIVGITARLNPVEAVTLAVNDGERYGHILHEAHPLIAAFGGMFLLMLFLDFVFEENELAWLTWVERPLQRIGKLDQASVVVALVALVLTGQLAATGEEAASVLAAGVLGVVTYIAVNGLGRLFEVAGDEAGDVHLPGVHPSVDAVAHTGAGQGPTAVVQQAGKAAFFLFLYLEVLDASFSFDGVIGAFAITSDPVIIALGLGVGAMYIRSLTVFLVRKGTLNEYVYLDHGAHWAIGALAVLLLVSVRVEVPEVVTGLIGVGLISVAFVSSVRRNRRLADEAAAPADDRPAAMTP
jgi:hypothetical protein